MPLEGYLGILNVHLSKDQYLSELLQVRVVRYMKSDLKIESMVNALQENRLCLYIKNNVIGLALNIDYHGDILILDNGEIVHN